MTIVLNLGGPRHGSGMTGLRFLRRVGDNLPGGEFTATRCMLLYCPYGYAF